MRYEHGLENFDPLMLLLPNGRPDSVMPGDVIALHPGAFEGGVIVAEEGCVFAHELLDRLMRIIRGQPRGPGGRASPAPVLAREETVTGAQPFWCSNDFMTFQLKHGQPTAQQAFRRGAARSRDGISGHSLITGGFEATVEVRQGRTRLLSTECGNQRQ
jgi:hypothetical protein